MSMHITVDLFANATDNIRWTTTLFVLKFPTNELLGNLMNWRWYTKYHIEEDIITYIISRSTIVFNYHIGRQTLYTNFQFGKFRRAVNHTYDAIKHELNVNMVYIECMMQNIHKNSKEINNINGIV